MRRQYIQFAALVLILASLATGGVYYWGTSTIVADTSPPVINEQASTHGKVAYGTGKPTVLLFVDENLGMMSATAELKTPGGFLGLGSTTVEKLTLTLDQKMDSDTYKYRGAFTKQLDQNVGYTLIYQVFDHADRGDTWTTTLETVNLAGVVYVNDVKVEGASDTIYVKTLALSFVVKITQGGESVSSVYATVNGQRLNFVKATSPIPGSGTSGSNDAASVTVAIGDYTAAYTLPKDGKYSFTVQILDAAGGDTQLASFNIQLGTQYQLPLLVGVLGLLAAGGLYFYLKKPEKRRRSR